ncbi:transcriptional regulator [Dickeya dianthicola RNS04.9]|nr:transcriptional regulator [Dickeya dianthicola RNS04.9]
MVAARGGRALAALLLNGKAEQYHAKAVIPMTLIHRRQAERH